MIDDGIGAEEGIGWILVCGCVPSAVLYRCRFRIIESGRFPKTRHPYEVLR